MCGIGGFSLSTTSKINPRKLSNALLTEMDSRGNQASGYAYQSNNSSGFYKKSVAGSKLNLKGMSRGAKVAILHTRYATHGSINNNANNHPVQSPDSSISLVHNGVIYNHNMVRGELPYKLPEVDSSVIPAMLENFDRDFNKFSMLDGDASVAWLDEDEQLTLRVARISHSPLCVAQTADGSFIFASTENILLSALKRAGIKAIYIEDVLERRLLVVRGGRIDDLEILPELDPKYEDLSYYNYSNYRSMTSGGTKANIGYAGKSNTTPNTVCYQSAFGDVEIPNDWFLAGDEYLSDEFPQVKNLACNTDGEYFDSYGDFIGTVEDLVQWGYIEYDGTTHAWDDGFAISWNISPNVRVGDKNPNFDGGMYGLWD